MSKATRFRLRKYFWASHIPITIVLYFFFHDLWTAISVLYLVLLSQVTQVDNLDGAEQAAEAANAS